MDRIPHIKDFTDLDEEEFIEAAYRAALKRAPDPGGAAHYRGLLERGISHAEILTYLVESSEGRPIGSRIDGLTWARRRARAGRMPVINQLLAGAKRIWPGAYFRRDLRRLEHRLGRTTERLQAFEANAKQRHGETLLALERFRVDLEEALNTRATVESLSALRSEFADRAQVDALRDDLRSMLYRGIDDVSRTFRLLLDVKADSDAVTEFRVAFDDRLTALQVATQGRLQELDARKADADALTDAEASLRTLLDHKAAADVIGIRATVEDAVHDLRERLDRQIQATDETRNEVLDALRTAFTGLTGSVSAVAASRIDRATMDAMLDANSQAVLAQVKGSIQELRSAIEELSTR